MTSFTLTKVALSAMLVLATLCSHFAAAQSTQAPDAITLSFTSGEGTTVYESKVDIPFKGCIQVSPQATAFKSFNSNAVFAVYKDNGCKTYSYSVEGSLASLDGAKSLSYDQFDSANAHAQGVTFIDSSIHQSTSLANRTVLIAVAITGAIAFFALSCGALYCLERKKKNAAGLKVPQIEVTASGLPLYNNSITKSQEANTKAISSSASAASSVAYLPAYTANNNNNNNPAQ
ncbi:hypothetical protein BGZ95_005560 [Linnemannia exigua]|uniref:Uncharacterized protein n=1 Tax=Linnemannia exigua TaxID=604196 RepID=A0AAD4DH33_9FUNG|nr:hypothetical protein BGZ95_005560 [Linnemannia exigua]